jgi:hypothetical protein
MQELVVYIYIYIYIYIRIYIRIYIYTYIYKTRLVSKEIVSPSNKIPREVGRAKDLSAPRYNIMVILILCVFVGLNLKKSGFRLTPRYEEGLRSSGMSRNFNL